MPKASALLLTPEAPYPLAGGGALRTASILQYLADRYELDVIVFREPGAADPRNAFPNGLVRQIDVIELPYHRKDPITRGLRNLRRLLRGAPPLVDRFARSGSVIQELVAGREYSLGVLEHFWCARYGRVLRDVCERVVLDLHNVESVLLTRCAQAGGWANAAAMHRFSHACRKLEQRYLADFDLLLVSSEVDRGFTSAIAPTVRTAVYPNAIPLVAQPRVAQRNAVVFSGNLEYHPNAGAIRYFYDRIWPLLRERLPDVEWHIVGKNPRALPQRVVDDPRVRVIGAVEDAVKAIACCRCAVVPLLAGSGTRIKIIEAWAAGVPVVSTTVGAEGLPCTPGEHLLIADLPADFVRAVTSVLEFPELGAALGRNGRELYEAKLTWNAAWENLQGSF